MILSTANALYAISNMSAVLGGGTLKMYSGSIPAQPELAPTGSLLATFSFNSPGFVTPTSTGTAETLTASLAGGGTATPSANGGVGYARAAIVPVTWTINGTYALNQCVAANSNLYVCTHAGAGATSGSGPSTTAAGITDGASAVWAYYGPSSALTVADYSVGTAPPADIMVGSTMLATTVPITITSFVLSTPAQ